MADDISATGGGNPQERMITAMTTLLVILLIALAMAVGTVLMVLHDGRGPAGPPRSHIVDPQFRSPGAMA